MVSGQEQSLNSNPPPPVEERREWGQGSARAEASIPRVAAIVTEM